MNLDSVSIQQVMDFLLKVGFTILAPSSFIFITLRFFGHKLFGALVEGVIDNYYEKVLKVKLDKTTEDLLKENKSEITIIIDNTIEKYLENHTIRCRNQSLTLNDDRYLLRQEFKMYMENQTRTNERLEETSDEIRKLCDLILLKLNN